MKVNGRVGDGKTVDSDGAVGTYSLITYPISVFWDFSWLTLDK